MMIMSAKGNLEYRVVGGEGWLEVVDWFRLAEVDFIENGWVVKYSTLHVDITISSHIRSALPKSVIKIRIILMFIKQFDRQHY